MQTIAELLVASPLFAGLAEPHRALIAGCGRNVRFAEDALILREGAAADRFYLLRRGAVALELVVAGRQPLVIETVGGGETLGWSWLFEPYRWQFDARAIEPVAAIEFDAVCIRGKCDTDHELGYQLMRSFAGSLADRLQATRLQLQDVYGHARA
jgi:CRP/FNR family transcriptional regulator, cyclic AMP receptor protein